MALKLSSIIDKINYFSLVFESSAQLPAGIVGIGNYHAEGLFDECLAIRADEKYKGQYCTVFLKPEPIGFSKLYTNEELTEIGHNETSPLLAFYQGLFKTSSDIVRVDPKLSNADASTYIFPSFSLCLPSSCSSSDLGQSVAHLVGSFVIANQSIVTITDEHYCFTEDSAKPEFDGPTIAVM